MAEVQEQDILSKKVKHSLENWREIILFTYDFLIWKSIPVYPGAILGLSTFIFICIVLLDPTLLSFISSICLIIVILDYVVPILMTRLFHPDSWTGQKEKKFEEICLQIANSSVSIKNDIYYFYSLKDTRPKIYYPVVIFGLLFLSWLGNTINNIFLTYLCVTYILMLPGLKHNGYLQKASNLIRQYLTEALRSVGSKKEKKQ
ncbi:hypothetical protein PGB90_007856 [Kerria lacca]